jgi:hypothetical protein
VAPSDELEGGPSKLRLGGGFDFRGLAHPSTEAAPPFASFCEGWEFSPVHTRTRNIRMISV